MTPTRGTPRRSRRDLFAGGARGDAGAERLGRPRGVAPRYHLRLGREAMACRFEIFLRPEDRGFTGAVHEAFDEIDRIEAQLTVYRDESEVVRLNRAAAQGPVPVDAGLLGLLGYAREVGRATGGAFDLTAGPLVRCWGFHDRQGRIPDAKALAEARSCTGWDLLDLDLGAGTVAFRRAGVELNFGAIGKGYALDRAAARLRAAGLGNFLIHAGHSSIVAAGSSNRGPGWPVSLRDPHEHGRSLGTLRLADRSLSTSGIGEQAFTARGRRFSHLLDPRTGLPAEGIALASVVAPQAALAEALSTAFVVLGTEGAARYCEGHPGVGSILVPVRTEAARPATPIAFGISLESSEASS